MPTDILCGTGFKKTEHYRDYSVGTQRIIYPECPASPASIVELSDAYDSNSVLFGGNRAKAHNFFEQRHNWVQYAFATTGPVINGDHGRIQLPGAYFDTLRHDKKFATIQQNQTKMLNAVMTFWGFKRTVVNKSDCCFTYSDDWQARLTNIETKLHNLPRMTRVIDSLFLYGLQDQLKSFLHALVLLCGNMKTKAARDAVSNTSLPKHWLLAVARTLGQPAAVAFNQAVLDSIQAKKQAKVKQVADNFFTLIQAHSVVPADNTLVAASAASGAHPNSSHSGLLSTAQNSSHTLLGNPPLTVAHKAYETSLKQALNQHFEFADIQFCAKSVVSTPTTGLAKSADGTTAVGANTTITVIAAPSSGGLTPSTKQCVRKNFSFGAHFMPDTKKVDTVFFSEALYRCRKPTEDFKLQLTLIARTLVRDLDVPAAGKKQPLYLGNGRQEFSETFIGAMQDVFNKPEFQVFELQIRAKHNNHVQDSQLDPGKALVP